MAHIGKENQSILVDLRRACKEECIEIRVLRTRVTVAGAILGILLGTMLTVNLVILQQTSLVSASISAIKTQIDANTNRLNIQRNDIDYLIRREIEENKQKADIEIWNGKRKENK